MTEEKQDILEDFYEADEKDIQFTIVDQSGDPLDLDGAEITWALFSDDGKNPHVELMKSSKKEDEIEVTGTGICVVHLLPGDTLGLYGTYRYQLHVVTATQGSGIVSSGKVYINRSFAKRYETHTALVYLQGG